jgi:hypothetical protein
MAYIVAVMNLIWSTIFWDERPRSLVQVSEKIIAFILRDG